MAPDQCFSFTKMLWIFEKSKEKTTFENRVQFLKVFGIVKRFLGTIAEFLEIMMPSDYWRLFSL